MQPEFDCHSLSYERVTNLTILWNVSKAFVYIFNVKVKTPVVDRKRMW